MRRLIFIAMLLFSIGGAHAAEVSEQPDWCDYKWNVQEPVPSRLNLPSWACEVIAKQKLALTYSPTIRINPFFLTGDFDGDHHTDIAIWITNRKTEELGLVIIHAKSQRVFVIGAGNVTERGKDLKGYDMWTLLPKGKVAKSPYEEHSVTLLGDALLLTESESASAMLYWNGKTYVWYQISD